MPRKPLPATAQVVQPGDTVSMRPDGSPEHAVIAKVTAHGLCAFALLDLPVNVRFRQDHILYLTSAPRVLTFVCPNCRTECSAVYDLVDGMPNHACPAGCR
ncbi:hypothetical protein GCM10027258_92790 [Amycolatopsis stemonae]